MIETAARILIIVLAVFFSLIPPFMAVTFNEDPEANPVWLFLGWWAPFAVPVLALAIVLLRHQDSEHGSNVDDVFR